jgi:leader peptidase (prepilin peptidase) / N-methyltransferase
VSSAMSVPVTNTSEWSARRLGRDTSTWWAGPLAVVFAAATFVHLGRDANAAAFALAQVVLVALAAIDVASRRLPNALTIPSSFVALALRALFERSHVGEVVVAGLGAFVAFLAVSLILRGGLGMGDVKLAGMLGALLGWKGLDALALGILVGGVVSMVLLTFTRAGLRSALAYGPCLAFGGVVGILFLHPPALV